MTLQDLRYVVALADHGHFGRAAAACDVGQSTLSTQLKKLEAQLGVTLFERTTQSVSMTAIGADIAARARQVLLDVEGICSAGQRTSGPLTGKFSLGTIPTLGPYLLETLALFDEPFWFAEPKGRRPGAAKVMKEADLRGQRLLLLTEGHCLRDQALAICGTMDRDAEDDFRATSLETIVEMVATGLGSTLLPAMACTEARSRAVATRPLEAGVGRRICLAWRRSYPKPRDIHLIADTLRDNLPPSVQRV